MLLSVLYSKSFIDHNDLSLHPLFKLNKLTVLFFYFPTSQPTIVARIYEIRGLPRVGSKNGLRITHNKHSKIFLNYIINNKQV